MGAAVGPFLTRVGEARAEGTLAVLHEHFAGACVADLLRALRAPYDEGATGPVAAALGLEGDLHEGGLLMASLVLARRGWRVLHLGGNTPVAELDSLPGFDSRLAPLS